MTQTFDEVISENYGLQDQKTEVVSTQEDSQRIIAAIATAAGDLGVKLAVVNQREVGSDTKGFGNALRHVLRQDPDVILVGEMRDLETIS